jgi:hypothetical protein
MRGSGHSAAARRALSLRCRPQAKKNRRTLQCRRLSSIHQESSGSATCLSEPLGALGRVAVPCMESLQTIHRPILGVHAARRPSGFTQSENKCSARSSRRQQPGWGAAGPGKTGWGRGTGYNRGSVGVWRSLVAHLLWEQGVQGSNPCTPTIISPATRFPGFFHARPVCLIKLRPR